MKHVKLQFPDTEEIWNYIAAVRKSHLEVEEAAAEGWFTQEELELASKKFGARVQELTPKAIELKTPANIETDAGQPVELYGKSGRAYLGKIYTKASHTLTLTSPALICLANSVCANGTWQHAVNAIYTTDNAEQERERFSQRDDVSHLIVVPAQELSGTEATDDLIRSYLHG